MVLIKLWTAFLFFMWVYEGLTHTLSVRRHYGRADQYQQEKQIHYYCTKLKECTPGDVNVCGFDESIPYLAVFNDACTVYKANCNGAGVFVIIDMVVCETRMAYDKEHENDTLYDVIHVQATETEPTEQTQAVGYIRRPAKVKLV